MFGLMWMIYEFGNVVTDIKTCQGMYKKDFSVLESDFQKVKVQVIVPRTRLCLLLPTDLGIYFGTFQKML